MSEKERAEARERMKEAWEKRMQEARERWDRGRQGDNSGRIFLDADFTCDSAAILLTFCH